MNIPLSKAADDAIEILLRCGWTQKDIARAVGVSQAVVSQHKQKMRIDRLPDMAYEAMSSMAKVNAVKHLIKMVNEDEPTDTTNAMVAKRLMEVVHGYADMTENLPLQDEILACERIMERLIKHGKQAALEDVQWCYDQLKKELK